MGRIDAPYRLSRRRLLRGVAGTVALAPALSLWRPAAVGAGGGATASPIPGGSPGGPGIVFHAYGPGPDNLNADPSTVTDFTGTVGLAYLNGMVTRTNLRTGEVRQLPFVESDMRFMAGQVRGTDGTVRQAAFALI